VVRRTHNTHTTSRLVCYWMFFSHASRLETQCASRGSSPFTGTFQSVSHAHFPEMDLMSDHNRRTMLMCLTYLKRGVDSKTFSLWRDSHRKLLTNQSRLSWEGRSLKRQARFRHTGILKQTVLVKIGFFGALNHVNILMYFFRT